MIYFNHLTQAFIDSDIHAVCENCIELNETQHIELLNKINQGCLIFADLSASEPKPSQYHQWNDELKQWIISDEAEQTALKNAKFAKLQALNNFAQSVINQQARLNETPDFEVRTWVIQGEEAKAWKANPNAPTPNLDQIAKARGIPADVLKHKAYEKSIAFANLTAYVAGKRQGYEDAINKAQTIEAVNDLAFDFALPSADAE